MSFLTTLSGEALISISYNKPINETWVEAATALAATLDARIVGRSRGVKLVVGGETVSETLEIPGRGACTYTQTEGSFTQPNAKVCEQMLGWAFDATPPCSLVITPTRCASRCWAGHSTRPVASRRVTCASSTAV